MVGVWKADNFNWMFKFEPDGTISKFVHSMGMPIVVEEGGFYEEGNNGSYGMYVLGPCHASYDPNTQQLNVVITLDYFRMEMPIGVLEGRCKDYFDGMVSKNGKKWQVNWRSHSWLEGADPPNIEAIDADPVPLVFTKVDIDKLRRTNQ